ncbi:2-dehydropantoate 2-reductase [Agromyces sp. SYSU K20354]|uniref:ketopantoate reductase family protein n=1 Tax=Agromyces cavernae TaxID=2898659 RepID=UPI001E4BBE3B|nr:2-dehydropantoate 2-reductase [Agromyces cavernae]MCD2443868.1 2-dehydropantoate 2-reductase [Agromyces cavernae]
MRIGIIGAGALGGTFAALLARAGHDVEVTARGAGLAAIREGGIRMSGGYGDAHAAVTAAETLPVRPDLVLVCTKAQDAPAAITANAALIDGVPVVVVQNGLDGVATAARLLPRSSCMGLLSIIAANYTEPGVVRVTTPATSYLGRGDGPVDAECVEVAAVLSDAAPVVAIDGFRGAQWTKLIVNMLNAVPAIVGESVQDVVDDPRLRRVVAASMREAVRVGIARGIRFGSLQGLGDRRLRLFARLPLAIGQVLPWSMRVRMGGVPNLGSTQQSLRRGQPTEIDFLNGAVVREASAAGLDAPVSRALTALVHEVERRGEPLTPERVLAEVPV